MSFKGIQFGQRYTDNSGWQWRIALTDEGGDRGQRIEIEGTDTLNWGIEDIDPREMADALNAIADMMDGAVIVLPEEPQP